MWEEADVEMVGLKVLVREYQTSLWVYGRSDRRNPSGQEGKLFYAERASVDSGFEEFRQTP